MGMNRMTASLYVTGTKALKKKLSKPMPHLLSRENLGCYCGDKTGNRLNERKTLKSWFTKHRKKDEEGESRSTAEYAGNGQGKRTMLKNKKEAEKK